MLSSAHWRVASGYEDEKQTVRQAMQGHHGSGKRTNPFSSTDQQLFRGEPIFSIVSIVFCASFPVSCHAIIFQNPTENLVSSNVKISNNLAFYYV